MTVILFDLVNDISLNANTFESKIFENISLKFWELRMKIIVE